MEVEDKLTTGDIKIRAVKSVKWTAFNEIVSRSIRPITILILARLLTPADFGIVGVATIVTGLAQIFQEFGLGKTLIQRETEVNKSANIIFWANIMLSLFLYLIIFLSAPLIAKFFYEPKAIDVLRVLCLQIVLFSLVSVHQALFQRKFQFKQIFFIKLSSGIIPAVVSIPLALLGYGVWSLVYGTLAGAVVQIFFYWRASLFRPQLSFDFQLARRLFKFSSWVTLEAFLGWLIIWGDSIVLGHFLGIKELGVYRVGITSLMFIFGFFFNPLIPIAYSSFSRLQSNLSEVKQAFLTITKLAAAVSLPIGFGLAILAKPIASIVFGQRWSGIEFIISILAISEAISWLVGHNPEVYRAIGRPSVNSILLIVAVSYFLPIYVIAAPHGLYIFCFAKFGVTMMGVILHFFAANKVLHLPFTYFWEPIKVPLVGAILMGFIIYGITTLVSIHNLPRLIISILSCGVFYLLSLWVIKKDFVKWSFRHAMEVVVR